MGAKPLQVEFIKYPEGTRYYQRHQCTYMKVPGAMYSMHSRNRRCKHSALYLVDGVMLCQLHAGRAALKNAMGDTFEE